MKTTILLATLLLLSAHLFSQRTIVGKVVDHENEPLIGACITDNYLNPDKFVCTDMEGNYKIEVAQDCASLNFSFELGFDVPLGISDTLNVILPYAWTGKLTKEVQPVNRQHPLQVAGKVRVASRKNPQIRVTVKGTKTSITVDRQGHFSMTVPPGHDVLVFSGNKIEETEIVLGDFQSVYVGLTFYSIKKRWWQFWRRG